MAAGLVSVARRQLREVTSIAQKAGIAMVLTLRTITWAVDTCANVTHPRASHLAAATVAPSRTRTDIGRGLRLLTGRSASRNPSRARLGVRAPDLSNRDRWRGSGPSRAGSTVFVWTSTRFLGGRPAIHEIPRRRRHRVRLDHPLRHAALRVSDAARPRPPAIGLRRNMEASRVSSGGLGLIDCHGVDDIEACRANGRRNRPQQRQSKSSATEYRR